MKQIPQRLAVGAAAGALICAPLVLVASSAANADAPAPDSTKLTVVSPSTREASKWTAQAYDCDQGNSLTPQQGFANYTGAPLGQGGHFMTLGKSVNQTELYRTTTIDGTKLANLTALDYSTMVRGTAANGAAKQPLYLRLTVSSTGSGVQDATLYFEPALNSTQGGVKQNTWQSWTAGPSSVWTTTGGPEGAVTLTDYVTAHPDATVVNNDNGNLTGGGLAVLGGCGGEEQTESTLAFDRVVATTGGQTSLWDFEADGGPATTNTITVKDATGTWNGSAYNYSGNGGAGAAQTLRQGFTLGPILPSLGKGSREMIVKDNSDATQFWRNTALDGKRVDAVRELSYSTYASHVDGAPGAPVQQPAYLRLSIASNGTAVKDTTLNFEPANNQDQQNVADNVWQNWDAFKGEFRVVEGPGETAGGLTTLAGYMARHPQAVFAANPKSFGGTGALSLVVGSAGDQQRNGIFAVDKVNVGYSATVAGQPATANTTWDFEASYRTPTANNVSRTGAGIQTLSGTAAPSNLIEVRLMKAGKFDTVAGTATADSYGRWSLPVSVSSNQVYRAYLSGSYGTTDIASGSARADVRFLVDVTARSARGHSDLNVKLNPAVAGVPVHFQEYVAHRGWVTRGTVSTNKNGAAAFSASTVRGRHYQWRANVGSTSTVLGNYSAVKATTGQ